MEPDTKKVEEAQPAAAPAPAKDQQQANKKAKGEKTKHGEGSHRGRSNKKGMVELEPVIGTRDFYPEDMRVRNWLFGSFREVARQFCFQVRYRNFPVIMIMTVCGKFRKIVTTSRTAQSVVLLATAFVAIFCGVSWRHQASQCNFDIIECSKYRVTRDLDRH
jgi:hypothetical protein